MFLQDAPFFFGDGQNAEFPLPTHDKGDDPLFIDGDVRNTRVNLTWDGPTGTSLPKLGAQVELDFFAGTFGGGFGNAQAVPRIRLAFADIALGPGTFRIGQNWAPWFGNVPVSLTHLAFPLGYGSAGGGGWRFVGLWYILPLTPKDAALGATLTLAVMRNSWGGTVGLNPPNNGNTGIPQLEGRIDVTGKAGKNAWSAYVVGHFDQKDLDARGDAMDSPTLSGFGGELGVKVAVGPFSIQGNGHYSKAMGQQFAQLTQFGDIAGFGFWGQAGFELTPAIAVYAFFGMEDPDDDDVRAAVPIVDPAPTPPQAATTLPRLRNLQAAAMIRYKVGAFQIGLEYMFDQLTFQDLTGEDDVSGNQVALSGMYSF
jgi:hypothetical protein